MTVIWTVMPPESLLPKERPVLPPRPAVYCGVPLLVESASEHSYKIVRLLSTDPNDYLAENLQPGTLISFQ